MKIFPSKSLIGEVNLPGDKSISHRSVIIGALSEGEVIVKNFLDSEDCRRTIEAFCKMGVNISYNNDKDLVIKGVGLRGLKEPKEELYLGNSGTTMRLMLGVLAAQSFSTKLTGDDSLNSRPMKRVTLPLSEMGARFEARGNNYAPIMIHGAKLKAISYTSPIASAQVKSAILLAGLYADGVTRITEPYKSRDHTERMLKHFKANIEVDGNSVSIHPTDSLEADSITVPSDISSAIYFIVASLIISDSKITIKNVGVNPTRIGALNILKDMGANIEILNKTSDDGLDFEPRADIIVESSKLCGITINKELIPSSIDELPIIMVAACFASGETKIYGASELRVKETDRIASMVDNLKKMNANIKVKEDNIFIRESKLTVAELNSFNDHRTAMSLIVSGTALSSDSEKTTIDGTECITTSFPDFIDEFNKLNPDKKIID